MARASDAAPDPCTIIAAKSLAHSIGLSLETCPSCHVGLTTGSERGVFDRQQYHLKPIKNRARLSRPTDEDGHPPAAGPSVQSREKCEDALLHLHCRRRPPLRRINSSSFQGNGPPSLPRLSKIRSACIQMVGKLLLTILYLTNPYLKR